MSTSTFDSTTVRVGPGPFAMFIRTLLIMCLVVGALVVGVQGTRYWYNWWYDINAVDVAPDGALVVGERLIFDTPHGEETLKVRDVKGLAATIVDLDGDMFTCTIAGLLSGTPDCTANVSPADGVPLVQTDYMDDSEQGLTFPCTRPYLKLDQSAWSCDGVNWNQK